MHQIHIRMKAFFLIIGLIVVTCIAGAVANTIVSSANLTYPVTKHFISAEQHYALAVADPSPYSQKTNPALGSRHLKTIIMDK
jgi:hypothetical protein